MAGGVNVKMGVSGVAQFKQSMNQARQSVKTLDAQLALNEKQFKASGDAEAYMEEKTKLLQAKLEEQKTVAANAEKALQDMASRGVDRASKAYQDMQQQLYKAKGDMLDTQNALNDVAEAGEEAGNGVDAMNAQLKRVGEGISWQNVTEGLSTITGSMEKVIKKAWQTGEALVKATLGAGAWADELITTSTQYGITPEMLQRMRKTANLIDTDVDTILNAQDKLKKGLGKADKETMGAFAAMVEQGLLPKGYNPKDKQWGDVFWDAGEALLKMSDETEREVYAQKLFGRSWKELIPLFKAGRTEYEKTNESWSVVEQDQLDNLGKMDDAYQKMNAEWETFKMEMLSAFSGPLTEGMEVITGLFRELNAYLDTPEGQAMLAQIGETISGLITDLTDIDPAEVVAGLQTVIDNITKGLQWINDNQETVVAALKAILGGWAVLKIGGTVAEILKIVNAVTGLVGGGTAATAGATLGASWAGSFATAAMKASPFLAFLYTLLNPSSGSDALGNNNAFDEKGELTEEMKRYGWRYDENGNLIQDIDQADKSLLTEERKKELMQEKKQREEAERQANAPKPVEMNLTPEQLAATQKWWDTYRGNRGDFIWEGPFSEFEKAFEGQEDLFDRVWEIIDQFRYDHDDSTGEDLWRMINDLPAELFSNPKQDSATNKLTDAANGLKGLPAATAAEVRRQLKGVRVYIDGNDLTGVVGQIMARYIV